MSETVAPKVKIAVETDLEQRRVALTFDPVKVFVYLDEKENAELAAALVKAGQALQQNAKTERREVVIPRSDGPILPKPGFLSRTPRHKK